ncbi:hypothetical protein TYRP_000045 [Tyrophagus putrescentiae]|nr:hypothetical protein TYRP_000045 [Tyrophagus putrescentiae]
MQQPRAQSSARYSSDTQTQTRSLPCGSGARTLNRNGQPVFTSFARPLPPFLHFSPSPLFDNAAHIILILVFRSTVALLGSRILKAAEL